MIYKIITDAYKVKTSSLIGNHRMVNHPQNLYNLMVSLDSSTRRTNI